MKSIFLLAALLAALTSCETLVTDIPGSRLPQTSSMLVVHAFISPQDPRIDVSVSESVPLFSESDAKEDVIKNAVVKISDGRQEVVLPFDPKASLYSIEQSRFQISASRTYKLTVLAGDRQVTAQCTVPATTPVIKSYELDTMLTANPFFAPDTALTLRMHWQDIAGETNYYRVMAAAEVEYNTPVSGKQEKRVRNQFDFIWDAVSGRSEWQSDRNLDGVMFTSPLGKAQMPNFTPRADNSSGLKPFNARTRLLWVTMMLYNTDINYFKYHRSIQERMDTDNPFTEPSVIYGNIEGGLGCFGAYNIGKVIYKPR